MVDKSTRDQARDLFLSARYENCLSVLASVDITSDVELRIWKSYSLWRINRKLDALEEIKNFADREPISRRLQIFYLLNLSFIDSVIEVLKDTLKTFPNHAIDFLYFTIQQSSMSRKFEDCRHIFECLLPLVDRDFPGERQGLFITMAALDERRMDMNRMLASKDGDLFEVQYCFDFQVRSFSREYRDSFLAADIGLFVVGDAETTAPGSVVDLDQNAEVLYRGAPRLNAKAPSCYSLRDALLTEWSGRYAITFRGNEVIPEICDINSSILFGLNSKNISGRYDRAFLLPPLGDAGYFNFINNVMFPILFRNRFFPEFKMLSLARSPMLDSFSELVALTSSDLEYSDSSDGLQFSRLVTVFNDGRHLGNAAIELFEDFAGRYAEGPRRRLYISRRKAAQRRLSNEKQVEDLCRRYGYEVVALEDYALVDQIRMMANCSHVVAPHGAGIINIIFSRVLSFLVEIMPDNYQVRGFENLACRKGASYVSLLGTSHEGGWTVDLHSLDKVLLECV